MELIDQLKVAKKWPPVEISFSVQGSAVIFKP